MPVRVPLAASVSAATKSAWTPGPHEHPGGGGAVLAGVEVAGLGDGGGRRLDVGVVEDDDRRLAAELEVDPLEVGRGRAGDLAAGPHRAGDRDHLRGPVLDQRRGRCPGRRRRRSARPGGRNSWQISASSVEEAGVVSLGLRTTVLPAARAGAIFQIIIISG